MAARSCLVMFYKGSSDELFYWRLKSPNNRIIAIGGEGYLNINNVRRAFETMRKALRGPARLRISIEM